MSLGGIYVEISKRQLRYMHVDPEGISGLNLRIQKSFAHRSNQSYAMAEMRRAQEMKNKSEGDSGQVEEEHLVTEGVLLTQ